MGPGSACSHDRMGARLASALAGYERGHYAQTDMRVDGTSGRRGQRVVIPLQHTGSELMQVGTMSLAATVAIGRTIKGPAGLGTHGSCRAVQPNHPGFAAVEGDILPILTLLVGLIFLVVSLWLVVGGGFQLGPASPSMTALLFAAAGVGLIASGLRLAVGRMRVGAADMSISSTRLRVGEELSVSYRQEWKRATEVNRVVCQLVLRETVCYSRGTDTVVDTYDNVIQQVESPGRHFASGEIIENRYALRIPETGMHTFRPSGDNRIEWFVRVCVDISRSPDITQEYEITVLPEMAR